MTTGHIYFIKPVGTDGPVKIGFSTRPEGRLFELLEWSPVDLEIAHTMPGTYALEYAIHGCLALDHIRREWFRATPRVVRLLEDLRAGVSIEDAVDLSVSEGNIRTAPNPNRQKKTRSPKSVIPGIGLTLMQAECLKFVREYLAVEGHSPSYQQISDGIGLHSKSGVHRLIHALVERGRLVTCPDKPRSLALPAPDMARAS